MDEEKEIFKRCYYTCKRCNIRGNEASNNCIECIPNYTLYNNIMNISNCYPKYEYYYYFDESNNYICYQECPKGSFQLEDNDYLCMMKHLMVIF